MNIKDIKRLKNKERVEGVFLLSSNSVIKGRCGNYLTGTLSDGLNSIDFKMWNYKNKSNLKCPAVVKINGYINEYNGTNSLIVDILEHTKQSVEDCIEHTNNETDRIKNNIDEILSTVKNPTLKKIVDEFFKLYGKEFYNVPGAVSHHHNYKSGNAQHSLEVLNCALGMVDSLVKSKAEYKDFDFDLLKVGAALHDMGKVNSYDFVDDIPVMTNMGKYVDHIVTGLQILNHIRMICNISSDNEDYMRLCHIIASHHGNLEWGSPVRPCFTEALIVHHADMISSHVCMMEEEMGNIANKWSEKRSYIFGTRLAKMNRNNE